MSVYETEEIEEEECTTPYTPYTPYTTYTTYLEYCKYGPPTGVDIVGTGLDHDIYAAKNQVLRLQRLRRIHDPLEGVEKHPLEVEVRQLVFL